MCATFDDARAAVAARSSTACFGGELGTCGDGKFIDWSTGFASLKATFDKDGTLAGVEVHASNLPDTATTLKDCAMGPDRACKPVATEALCAPRPLSEQCEGKPCPTLAETMERLKGEGGCPPEATIDRAPCDGYVVIDERNAGAVLTRYFDDKGKLVGVHSINLSVQATMRWGNVPKCTTAHDREPICPAPAAPSKAGKKRKK